MEGTELLDEIQDINLSYLMLAKRMLGEDYATAQFRLKLDDDLAQTIASLTTRQMSQLARSNQLLFRLAFRDAEQLKNVLADKLDGAMVQTHAAILMAGTSA